MYHVRLVGPSTLEYTLPCLWIWELRFNGWNGGIDELGRELFPSRSFGLVYGRCLPFFLTTGTTQILSVHERGVRGDGGS